MKAKNWKVGAAVVATLAGAGLFASHMTAQAQSVGGNATGDANGTQILESAENPNAGEDVKITPEPVPDRLDEVRTLAERADLEEAIVVCRSVVFSTPGRTDAWHMLVELVFKRARDAGNRPFTFRLPLPNQGERGVWRRSFPVFHLKFCPRAESTL